jgi:hypothetical protein
MRPAVSLFGLDLVASWLLAFFGTCAVGGLVGWLVARLSTSEHGLGVGLLLPGLVSLAFAARFAVEHHDFTHAPSRTHGRVVAVEARAVSASGNVTTPVAVVEFTDAGGQRRHTDSAGGSSWHAGDAVTVVYPPQAPWLARVGRPQELAGGAIAAMLFGVFPASAGTFFLASALVARRQPREPDLSVRRRRLATFLTIAGNVTTMGGILYGGLASFPVQLALLYVFGLAALGLWLHVLGGLVAARDPRWTLGAGVVAVNFTAFSLALWWLAGRV